MSEFRKLSEETICSGQVVSVATATFEGPTGERFQREVVHHPGAVAVVAVDESAVAYLVRQYRTAVEGYLLEVPAGKRDVRDEPPEQTARRELQEEVGMAAGCWELLAQFHTSPGFCDELVLVYLATELTSCDPRPQGVEESHMTVVACPLAEVSSLVESGLIKDAKTIIALYSAKNRLGNE